MIGKTYGLVLAGGKSQRMGTDKGMLKYHKNLPQWKWSMNLLHDFSQKVFLSISKGQMDQPNLPFPEDLIIVDKYDSIGPIGGIAAAMKSYPSVSWLICTVDQPGITINTLTQLINNSTINKDGTCFVCEENKKILLQPFPCLLNPGASKIIFEHIKNGNYSVKKSLDSMNTERIVIQDPQQLVNLNIPAERDEFLKGLT